MRCTIAVLAAVLAGCASPQVVSTNPRNVIVRMPIAGSTKFGAGEAANLGEAECAKYGRHARVTDRPDGNSREWVFECVT